MRVAALFAGIGGIETGFANALGDQVSTELFCETWEPAQSVLSRNAPDVELHEDVRELTSLPSSVNLVTAGFPCTDLSQAGRTSGIRGQASGLVSHVFGAIRGSSRPSARPTLVIENVPNMLALDRGAAMRYLVEEIEALGYAWAYRTVDSRFSGVPQRRRRVLLVASQDRDPRSVLFADEAGDRPDGDYADDAFGFYWTEGKRGLGWAVDAVPTVKGGSTVGIASPPGIWFPGGEPGRRFVKPSIEDAEALQGFSRGWTDGGESNARAIGTRWKLVGNAVTVGVAEWLASRLVDPGDNAAGATEWSGSGAWPRSAWGNRGKVYDLSRFSEFPVHREYRHLSEIVDLPRADPLTHRGAAGFWHRLQQGNLGRHPGFREGIVEHISEIERLAA